MFMDKNLYSLDVYRQTIIFISFSDAIYVAVQPSRQVAVTKMVRGQSRQDEEEDYSRTRHSSVVSETKNVQFP